MGNTEQIDTELATLNHAHQQLAGLLAEFDLLDTTEQLRITRDLEQFRNKVIALDLPIIAGLNRTGTPQTVCSGSMKQLLTSTLSISAGDAARRIDLAEHCGPRHTMLGEHLQPVRPVLAAAVADGSVSAEKALTISKGLQHVTKAGADPAVIAAGETELTAQARKFGPRELIRLTQRFVDAVDPDGPKPKDTTQQNLRHFQIRPTADGGYTGTFRLTASCGAKLTSLLRPLSAVRTDESGQTDERPYVQRQHDALEDLCDRLLRDGLVPQGGNPSVTVIVTIDADNLARKTGHATTTDGNLISTQALLDMASEADIIPTVLNHAGAVLDLGRTRRCASRTQTLALIARDLGCSFPGCHIAAEYSERHHIIPWLDGGLTNLDNLTLLCRYHHHNFLNKGWLVRLNTDRIPEWIPPKWVDPEQKPRINLRIHAKRLLR